LLFFFFLNVDVTWIWHLTLDLNTLKTLSYTPKKLLFLLEIIMISTRQLETTTFIYTKQSHTIFFTVFKILMAANRLTLPGHQHNMDLNLSGYGLLCTACGALLSALDHTAGTAFFYDVAYDLGLPLWFGSVLILGLAVLVLASLATYIPVDGDFPDDPENIKKCALVMVGGFGVGWVIGALAAETGMAMVYTVVGISAVVGLACFCSGKGGDGTPYMPVLQKGAYHFADQYEV